MQVITGSSDSTVRVWDAKTCDCIANFRPPQALAGGGERAVLDVHLNPQNVDHIIVCTRSSTLFIMTLQGQVKYISSGCLLVKARPGNIFQIKCNARSSALRLVPEGGYLPAANVSIVSPGVTWPPIVEPAG